MFKNITANIIGRCWSIISGFIFIPLYIKFLGFGSYSVISFTLIVAGIMAILDAGLTATLARELARQDRGNLEKLNVFRSLEKYYFIVVILVIGIILFLSDFIANGWLKTTLFTSNELSLFLKIIGVDIGFQLLFRFYIGGLMGLEKQVEANFYQIIWSTIRNGLVIGLIFFLPSLKGFFLWQALTSVIFAFLLKVYLSKFFKRLTKEKKVEKIEIRSITKLWKFAGGMFLISLVASLNTQVDKILISKLLPLESLGSYTLASSLAMVIISLVSPISASLLPRFTALYSINKNEEASLLFQNINNAVCIIIFAITANLFFFSREVIWIWTGNPDLASHSAVYLKVLIFSTSILALTMLPYDVAIANGYTKLNNILGMLSLLITLPGYFFAIRNYGAIGAAYLLVFVQLVYAIIYYYFIGRMFLKIKNVIFFYIKQFFFPFIGSFGVVFLFSYIPSWAVSNKIALLFWIGLSFTTTILISVFVSVPKSKLQMLFNRLLNFKTFLQK